MTPNRRALMKLTKAKLVEMVIEAEARAVAKPTLLEAVKKLDDAKGAKFEAQKAERAKDVRDALGDAIVDAERRFGWGKDAPTTIRGWAQRQSESKLSRGLVEAIAGPEDLAGESPVATAMGNLGDLKKLEAVSGPPTLGLPSPDLADALALTFAAAPFRRRYRWLTAFWLSLAFAAGAWLGWWLR
jgi:hypothetical protein